MDTRKTIITLTPEEAQNAMREGRAAVERVGGDPGFSVNGDTTTQHQIGCAGEIAVCKHMGIVWGGHGLVERYNGDAGPLEVRTTQRKKGRLLLNKRDLLKLDRKYVLVISLGNRQFELVGWAYGHEVVKPENLFNRPQFHEEVWALSQDQLREIRTLED